MFQSNEERSQVNFVVRYQFHFPIVDDQKVVVIGRRKKEKENWGPEKENIAADGVS